MTPSDLKEEPRSHNLRECNACGRCESRETLPCLPKASIGARTMFILPDPVDEETVESHRHYLLACGIAKRMGLAIDEIWVTTAAKCPDDVFNSVSSAQCFSTWTNKEIQVCRPTLIVFFGPEASERAGADVSRDPGGVVTALWSEGSTVLFSLIDPDLVLDKATKEESLPIFRRQVTRLAELADTYFRLFNDKVADHGFGKGRDRAFDLGS